MHASILLLATAAASVFAQTPDACVTKCNAEFNACRTSPGSNFAVCGSAYASCIGYLPFAPDGSLVTPTACAVTSTAVATGTTAATVTAPAVTPTPVTDACMAKCNRDYDACRVVPPGAPSANQSFCAAQYAACLGFSPFGTGPNGTFATPTACSAGATGARSGVASATGTGIIVASPTPSLLQANGASNVQGGIVGVAGLIAAALMI